MIKQVLYIIFFISVCSIKAQTITPIDTTHLAAPTTQTVEPTSTITQTIQATPSIDTAKATTTTTQTIQTTPTQTVVTTKPKKQRRYSFANQRADFKKENKDIAKLYHLPFDKKAEITLQNKRYRIYNNYLSAGVGKCYNSGWKEFDLNTGFDYNFHLHKRYFQVGGNLIGPALWNNSCIQLHAGWGYRFERCNYQLAAYGGLSYSNGYYLQQTDSVTNKIKMNTIGIYAALQCFYKLKFDYGIGLSAFFDANPIQTLTGIKIELFFSGAYRGNKKIDWKKEDEKY